MNDATDARSIRQLVGELSIDLRLLCAQLVGVAQAEARAAVHTATTSLVGLIAGGFTALVGVLVLVAALVLGAIAAGLPPWAAALLVGVLLVGGGGGTAYVYLGRLRRTPLDLPATRASVAETMTWLKTQTER